MAAVSEEPDAVTSACSFCSVTKMTCGLMPHALATSSTIPAAVLPGTAAMAEQ